MFRYYALDPVLMTNWMSFRFFASAFGIERGRLIVEYPKHWRRLVFDGMSTLSPMERKRIEEALRRMSNKLVKQSARTFDGTLLWLENAVAANQLRPFDAIVSNRNCNGSTNVVLSDRIDDTIEYAALPPTDTLRLWDAPASEVITRDPQVMADKVYPLLVRSQKILFVDKHFGPENSRHKKTFERFMLAVKDCDLKAIVVEIHCKFSSTLTFFESKSKSELAPITPSQLKVNVYRWEEEDLHNRFILTDKGGVAFLEGLDCFEGKGRDEDVIAILHPSTVASLISNFDMAAPKFRLVDKISFVGTMPV